MNNKNVGPIFFLAQAVLSKLAGKNDAFLAGDLEEEYFERSRRASKQRANAWYAAQVFQSIPPLLTVRLQQSPICCAVAAAMTGYAFVVLCSLAAGHLWPALTALTPPASWGALRAMIQSAEVVIAGMVVGMIVRREFAALFAPVTLFAVMVAAPPVWMIATSPAAGMSLGQLLLLLLVTPLAFAGAFMGSALAKPQR